MGCELRRDWLPNPGNGIVHGWGFGQSDFMWHLRQLPRVKAHHFGAGTWPFEALWVLDHFI